MQLVLKFRHLMPQMVVEEFDNIVATIRAFFGVEHKADGTHGAIHAESLTTTGPISGESLTISDAMTLPDPLLIYDAIVLKGSLPELGLIDTDEGVNAQRTHLIAAGQQLQLNALLDNGVVQQVLLTVDRQTGALGVLGAISERGRTVPLGSWIAVPYAASDFSASAGVWTVEAGDLVPFRYTLIGKTMIVNFRLFPTTLSVGATQLRAKIPGGYVSAVNAEMPIRAIDSGGRQTGNAIVTTGSNLILFEKINDTPWAAGTNTLGPLGTLIFEIQ